MSSPAPAGPQSHLDRREVAGWCFYDFANSAFSTSILTVIFAMYFKQAVVPTEGIDLGWTVVHGAALWGVLVSASTALVALSAPVLGAVADCSGRKKPFLGAFCYVGALATAMLVFVRPGDAALGIVLFLVANYAMEASLPFYNSFLPQIAPPEQAGRVSSWGWGFGYLGGALCLVLNLAMVQRPAWFGLSTDASLHVRACFVSVGVWWAVFALPTFLWVRSRGAARVRDRAVGYVRLGLREVLTTLRRVRRHRELLKFLVAFFVYNDGVQTVIAVSAIFAADVLGMDYGQALVVFLAIQVMAIPGSLITGHLADRLGHRPVLLVTLVVWALATGSAMFVTRAWHFWVLAMVIALVLGGTQSVSRSLFGRFTPAGKSAEFFGFYALSGKVSAILGTAIYAVLVHVTGNVRWATVGVFPLFVIGLILLWCVDEQTGVAQASGDAVTSPARPAAPPTGR